MLKSQKKSLALNTKPQIVSKPAKIRKSDKIQSNTLEEISNQLEKTALNSKQANIITLLQHPRGATIEEMVKTTGWQKHSVRGAISGVLKKRLGLSIASDVEERGRVYRIVSSVSRS